MRLGEFWVKEPKQVEYLTKGLPCGWVERIHIREKGTSIILLGENDENDSLNADAFHANYVKKHDPVLVNVVGCVMNDEMYTVNEYGMFLLKTFHLDPKVFEGHESSFSA